MNLNHPAPGDQFFPLSFSELGMLRRGDPALFLDLPWLPAWYLPFVADLPIGEPFSITRVATRGAFKTPGLRNVEFTGPYFHNGGALTLRQAVDFYARGGNFAAANLSTFDPDVNVLCGLNPNPDPVFCPGVGPAQAAIAEANQNKLVDFLLALTDERVRWEKAPFDHPALAIPNGATVRRGSATDNMLSLPAVGADGRAAALLPPVGTFLNLDPPQP